MKRDYAIAIHHLSRVEGHADIRITVRKGQLVEAQWAIVETPRFFEVMIKGMSAERVPFLTSRICGICSISHALASIRALERAMAIAPPVAAEKTRLLAMHGETLQSHALHLFFLIAPDFANSASVLPLMESHPDLVRAGLQLKELGNEISAITAGRCTHPVSLVVGGLSKAPDKEKLLNLRTMIQERKPALATASAFFRSLVMPDFTRETEFISLRNGSSYPSIGGSLVSSDGVKREENDYLLMTNEYTMDFSTSKFTRLSRESSVAGALARFNNNHDLLHPGAKEAAESLGLKPICHNPFMTNIAQLVECVHILEDAEQLINSLLDMELREIKTPYVPQAGAATGAVEAPRGILYHHMETDAAGKVVKANCIIPTTQNNGNIHHDLRALTEQGLREGKSDREIEKLATMLVRSYDPCISCSVH
ncbi:Ni/Fe hydrogenase subunit alpha [Pelodictyon phaeoclathratiforme]|jgi:coenzyme F420-reducing hydrogenase alpha subunit|uniref:Nickel-dependent hydrogenase large subunit n=1 Tax=Pelodictyon phaeoclathratiforme (strain DSM 5477 / BU-1) TaxID=324925 RepID=B4SFA3_PELPB|nr:Ni/Fe hydrogenase subunit alpha [Pelodictyon phaeoclathratiforme]ACF44682.1 nickel-dependent hydrogenase large subunit [Pelodictyon phaeoclathratiforme BU-1]MBV5288892.1 Ni/Fe hydrogenase subunit alpha [Pelodictyon phaeoclathratiforme]